MVVLSLQLAGQQAIISTLEGGKLRKSLPGAPHEDVIVMPLEAIVRDPDPEVDTEERRGYATARIALGRERWWSVDWEVHDAEGNLLWERAATKEDPRKGVQTLHDVFRRMEALP